MIENKEELVIIGAGEFAEIAYEYFSFESPYKVVAFSVEREVFTKERLRGLPIVPFEELEAMYPPSKYKVFVAVTYTQLNRIRTRLYHEVTREKGFIAISYRSPKSFIWNNVKIGDNCFIFENNVIQYNAQIGSNVILWSGNHVGHRAKIADNCYIGGHVAISGFCEIGENCFLGTNSSISDHVKIAKDCIIGAGAVVLRDTEEGKVYVGNPARRLAKSSFATFKVSGT